MKYPNRKKGLSLVELLVVFALITLVFGIILNRRSNFGERFRVEDQAYDMANSIRKAQTDTIGAKEFYCSTTGTKTFNASYGINIHIATQNHYHLFVDVDKDGFYCEEDGFCEGAPTCYYTDILFVSSNILKRLCGSRSNGSIRCYPGDGNNGPTEVDIVFTRPDSKPSFKFRNGDNIFNNLYPPVYMYFTYPGGTDEIEVKVEGTGQVSVELQAP